MRGLAEAILFAISCVFFGAAAGAPVANLPLTCASAGAIGQPQSACSELTYRLPTPELIVLKGSSSDPVWSRASSLTKSDTLVVCTLAVEPGTYSSCRDSAGVRRMALLPKSHGFPDPWPPRGGPGGISPASIAVVAVSGGRYTDPMAAVANVDQGDVWCRKNEDDPARFPCVISIAPGVYELASTLIVPAHVSVIGYGPDVTVLTARPGVAVTVQLGFAGLDPTSDVALRDLAVENRFGGGGTSVALDIIDNSNVEVYNVRATASGASENIGVRYEGRTVGGSSTRLLSSQLSRPFPLRALEAAATGGSTSTGFKVVNRGSPKIEECAISASEASTSNVGVESNGGATLARCEVTAIGGATATAMSIVGVTGFVGPGASSEVSDSKLVAEEASVENTGYFSRGTYGAIWKRVEVLVRGTGSVTGISLSQAQPFREGHFEDVGVSAFGGSSSAGMYLEGGHHDPSSMEVIDSMFDAGWYGIRFGPFATEGDRLRVYRSIINGRQAALFSDAPFNEWEYGTGPPLYIVITDTVLNGDVDLNRHYIQCTAVIHRFQFFPDTCPPGDWSPLPSTQLSSRPSGVVQD